MSVEVLDGYVHAHDAAYTPSNRMLRSNRAGTSCPHQKGRKVDERSVSGSREVNRGSRHRSESIRPSVLTRELMQSIGYLRVKLAGRRASAGLMGHHALAAETHAVTRSLSASEQPLSKSILPPGSH